MLPDLPQIVASTRADEDGGGEEALEELREVFAHLMLLLVALHGGSVVLASCRRYENLARDMATGENCMPIPATSPDRTNRDPG